MSDFESEACQECEVLWSSATELDEYLGSDAQLWADRYTQWLADHPDLPVRSVADYIREEIDKARAM
jgi:hypothetical protein